MSRYIDADAVENTLQQIETITAMSNIELGEENDDIGEISMPISTVRNIINTAPSIDIVRCGECMHNGSYDTDCPFGWRNGEWNMPKPCDFCSYGEREGE